MLKLFTWLMKPAVKRALDKVANDTELKEIEKTWNKETEELKKAYQEIGDDVDPRIKDMYDKLM